MSQLSQNEMLKLVDKNSKQINSLLISLKDQVSIYSKAFQFPNEQLSQTQNNQDFKKLSNQFAQQSFQFVDILLQTKKNSLAIISNLTSSQQFNPSPKYSFDNLFQQLRIPKKQIQNQSHFQLDDI